MNSSSAFGLLQEDTIHEKDFIRNHIKYIAPLYLERMHILYLRKKFKNMLPVLSQANEKLKVAFSDAVVSTGPQGSGSKIFASYLLSQCQINLKTELALGFKDALDKLIDGKIDVVFCIAGAPLFVVTELLEEHSDKIGLISIAPELFQNMNKNYGGYSQVRSFPLDQFDFRAAFEQEYDSFFMELLANIFLFIVSVSVATAGALVFLVRVSSGYKQSKYFRAIVQVYKSCLPENTELNEHHKPFPRPIIWEKQDEIITKLIRGISELLILVTSIRTDFEIGGITISHYNHLLESAYSIKDIFKRNLAQRINEVIETKSSDISSELLRHLNTAGYLTRENYQNLITTLRERSDQTQQ
jgi:hypothetical protein